MRRLTMMALLLLSACDKEPVNQALEDRIVELEEEKAALEARLAEIESAQAEAAAAGNFSSALPMHMGASGYPAPMATPRADVRDEAIEDYDAPSNAIADQAEAARQAARDAQDAMAE